MSRKQHTVHNIPPLEPMDRRNWMHRYYKARAKRIQAVRRFWNESDQANWDALRQLFTEDAYVEWVCTAEQFTVDEFIEVMKAYPGGERLVTLHTLDVSGNRAVTATEIRQPRTGKVHHVTAFFTFTADKIHSIVEYRTDGQKIPAWRKEMKVGSSMPAQQSLALRNT